MSKKAQIKAMQAALRKADLEAMENCVDKGFPLDELLFDGNNNTALHVAVDLQKHQAVEWLLAAGANPDIQNDQFKETALHKACEEGDLKAVTLLLQGGADADLQDENGSSPVMLAAEAPKKAKQIVECLLAAGASVKPNSKGRSPLHSAITDPTIVEQLVQAGFDANEPFHGITPLMKALENFFLNKVDPATRAFHKPQPKVVAALVDAGANPSLQFPRAAAKQSCSLRRPHGVRERWTRRRAS